MESSEIIYIYGGFNYGSSESLPNVGKITAVSIMEEIGINESRRVQGLGKRQLAMLLEKLA